MVKCRSHNKQIQRTLEKRAFPSVLHVSKVVSVDAARSVAGDGVAKDVKDVRLDDEGMDGSFSLHRGPSNCCSIALHLPHQTQAINATVNQ